MQHKGYNTIKIRLIALFCLLLTTGAVSAQSGNVAFTARTLTIKEAFGEIQRQTGYLFAFNHNVLDDSKVVALSKHDLTIAEALTELLKGTNTVYEVKGSHILIVAQPKQPQKQPAKPTTPARTTGSEWDWDWTSERRQPERQREPLKDSVPVVEKVVAVEEKNETPATKPEPAIKAPEEAAIEPQQPLFTISASDDNAAINRNSRLRSERYGMKSPAGLSLKTNLIYGAGTMTPNLSIEIGLSRRISLDLWGSYHPWLIDNSPTEPIKLEHWIARPEFRYWLRERSSGHFFGIHGFYSEYEIAGINIPKIFDEEFRYDGNIYGGGLTYGYHLMLGKRWGMEFSVSGGAGFFEYDKFDRADNEKTTGLGRFTKAYFGPTGAGIKLVFIIK